MKKSIAFGLAAVLSSPAFANHSTQEAVAVSNLSLTAPPICIELPEMQNCQLQQAIDGLGCEIKDWSALEASEPPSRCC